MNGQLYYYLEYSDQSRKLDTCSTVLTRDENGNFINMPLDNYDRLNEVMSDIHLRREELNVLPRNIGIGSLLQTEELIRNKRTTGVRTR